MSKSLAVELEPCSKGSTVFCYSEDNDSWMSGNSGGVIRTIARDNDYKEVVVNEKAITSMSICPDLNSCAISIDKQVNIHEFPDVNIETHNMVVRSSLDITHMAYDRDGAHM